MASMGKFLEDSGIAEALYKSGAFLQGATETSIMKGGDYVVGKNGMNLIAEVINRLQYEAFLENETYNMIKGFLNEEEIDFAISQTYDTEIRKEN